MTSAAAGGPIFLEQLFLSFSVCDFQVVQREGNKEGAHQQNILSHGDVLHHLCAASFAPKRGIRKDGLGFYPPLIKLFIS